MESAHSNALLLYKGPTKWMRDCQNFTSPYLKISKSKSPYFFSIFHIACVQNIHSLHIFSILSQFSLQISSYHFHVLSIFFFVFMVIIMVKIQKIQNPMQIWGMDIKSKFLTKSSAAILTFSSQIPNNSINLTKVLPFPYMRKMTYHLCYSFL